MGMRTEFLQDLKALAGVPLFFVVIVISYVVGRPVFALQLFVGLVLAYVLTFGIRTFYFRVRPDKEKYSNYLQRINASSFPSMHAMRASVFATLLVLFFQNSLLSVLFVLCALGVGVSRVLTKRHHASDVIVGWIFGVFVALFTVWLVARFIS